MRKEGRREGRERGRGGQVTIHFLFYFWCSTENIPSLIRAATSPNSTVCHLRSITVLQPIIAKFFVLYAQPKGVWDVFCYFLNPIIADMFITFRRWLSEITLELYNPPPIYKQRLKHFLTRRKFI